MTRSFTSPVQALTYRKVQEYLATSTLFQGTVQTAAQEPRFHLTYGSAAVTIDVLPWDVHPWDTHDVAIVKACSCVTQGTPVDAEVMRFLLTENQRMRFGAFQLDDDDRILFADTILGGDNMDVMELQACILAVVTIADAYDDAIVTRFGGQRALDLASPSASS